MTHLFLSDVHLGAFTSEFNKQLERELISLIEYCTHNSIHIHVLGDLFDYWMEFGDIVPDLGKNLLSAFSEYNSEVLPATYITGNHDNWTEGYFESIGFNIFDEYKELFETEKKIFLLHGDGLKDPKFELPRPFFHRLLRHPVFVRLYKKLLSADAGIDLMRQFSTYSRDNPSDDPQRLSNWARYFLKENDYQFIIAGHDHHPRVETFSFGTYINLGTFYADKTVGLYTNGDCNLVRWDADSNTFIPFK